MKAAAALCLFTAVAVRSQDPSITTESGSVVLSGEDVIFRTTGLEKTASGFVTDIETLSTGVSSGFAEAESARITLQNTLAASIDTGVSTIQEALSTSIVNEQNARDAFAEGLETSCNVTAGEAVVSISGGSATCSNAGLEAVQRTVDAAVASTRVYETRINDLQRQLNESQGGFECARRRQDAVNTAESTLQNGTLRRRMRCPNGRPPQKLNARSFRFRGNINRYDGPDHNIRVPESNSFRIYSSSHGSGSAIFDGVLRHWASNNYRAWHVRPGGMEVKLPRAGILLNFIVYCIRNTGSMTNPDERGYQCYDHGRYDIEHGYVEYHNGREWVRASTRTSGQYGNWIGKTEMQCGDATPTNWRFVFDWGSEVVTKKCRIIDVVYNASNNELVRTNTLVKNCVVQIDGTPFRQYYEKHYAVLIGEKKKKNAPMTELDIEGSKSVKAKIMKRREGRTVDPKLDEQFSTGRVFACISSRPGQSGRADGYILEGKELDFYMRKMAKKTKKA